MENRETVQVKPEFDSSESTTDESTINDPRTPQERRKARRELRKILREDSSLSLLKVSGTALTAVSMALISTQLTSVLNSLALVAIVSIGSAIVNEFYRVVLSVTSLGAKKVIAPIVMTNPDGSTTEIPAVQTVEPIPVATAAVSLDEAPRTSGKRSVVESIKLYFHRNPLMRMILLFTAVSAVTITANYFFVNSSERVESVTNYTTVQESPVEELTLEEKQNIIDSAVGVAGTFSNAQQETLQGQIDSLTIENSTLNQTVEELKVEQEQYRELLTQIQNQLSEMQPPVESTPADTVTPEPEPSVVTPTPKPSPTSAAATVPNAANSSNLLGSALPTS